MSLQRPAAMVVAVDALLAILLIITAVLALSTVRQRQTPPSIVTLGYYAITITWPNGNPDDVDLYVEDPQGNIVYFANPAAGLMNLQHDNLGSIGESQTSDGHTVKNENRSERVVLRGVIAGQYTVNVHEFNKRTKTPTTVTATLTRLAGDDKVVKTTKVVMTHTGQEKTEFRFTLNQQGYVTSTSTQFKEVVYSQQMAKDAGGASEQQVNPLQGAVR